MTTGKPFSREDFDNLATHLGITGDAAHMDELFVQVGGLMAGAEAILRIDVSDSEPDMAFIPADES